MSNHEESVAHSGAGDSMRGAAGSVGQPNMIDFELT
jgi:hypothetical protein